MWILCFLTTKADPLGQGPRGFTHRKEDCLRPAANITLGAEGDEGRDMFHLVPLTERVMSLH